MKASFTRVLIGWWELWVESPLVLNVADEEEAISQIKLLCVKT